MIFIDIYAWEFLIICCQSVCMNQKNIVICLLSLSPSGNEIIISTQKYHNLYEIHDFTDGLILFLSIKTCQYSNFHLLQYQDFPYLLYQWRNTVQGQGREQRTHDYRIIIISEDIIVASTHQHTQQLVATIHSRTQQ